MLNTVDARELTTSFDDSVSSQELRRNFLWFTLNFAVNHGVVTTPLTVSSSVLDTSAAFTGNALLNLFTVFSAFVLGAPVVNGLGLKGAVLFGMAMYCVYCGMFTAAYLAGTDEAAAQKVIFGVGSACGGVAAGVLWTAQGSYFARTVDLLARKEGTPRAQLTSDLAGTFAALYLGCEVCAKLAWACLDKLQVAGWITALSFTVVGVTAVLLQTRAYSLSIAGPKASWTSKTKAAVSLWSDPCVFLLAGINLTFGFSAGFMNGYVNANFTKVQLGQFAVPMLAAFTALLAAVLARVFGVCSVKVGKSPVVVAGSLAFFAIPFCFFASNSCDGWQWQLIVLYFLQGAGRAVYESTGKGIFADFFPNDSTGAFANNMLQNATAFALCFFLSDFLKGPTLAAIAMALSVLTPMGYFGACAIRGAQERRRQEEGASA